MDRAVERAHLGSAGPEKRHCDVDVGERGAGLVAEPDRVGAVLVGVEILVVELVDAAVRQRAGRVVGARGDVVATAADVEPLVRQGRLTGDRRVDRRRARRRSR